MGYYKEQIPILIENIKTAIEQCHNVIKESIDIDLSDDKMHAVLKGKRMAVDDVKHYAKEVELLEAELLGVKLETEDDDKNITKKYSKS